MAKKKQRRPEVLIILSQRGFDWEWTIEPVLTSASGHQRYSGKSGKSNAKRAAKREAARRGYAVVED